MNEHWRNTKEKRTPFLARGNSRVRALEEKIEAWENLSPQTTPVQFVNTLPEGHETDGIVYFLVE
jgi:hypothetical protein